MNEAEERIEVAGSLRRYEREEGNESAYDFIESYWPEDIADMIDPTCHEKTYDNLNEGDGTGDAWTECSKCGAVIDVLTDGDMRPRPRYCPQCGARIIRKEDE